MDEPILVVISLTMFVGSYLAGCIPLFFNLNERRIRVVSIFGAGLLVGTALCVIIPEGVSTLIESSQPHHKHAENAVKPVLQFESAEMHRAEQQQPPKGKEPLAPLDAQKRHVEGSVEPKEFDESADEKFDGGGGESAKRQRRSVKREIAAKPEGGDGGKNGGRHSDAAPPNLDGTIGVSLLVGFLFMFVVDQLAKLSHNRSKSLSTLGLVIHAFADGIAMGSASTAGTQLEMQILVFVAIMLHKAPAAFALVSILLAHGLEKTRIRRHLLIFSLAAPIGTILTYAFLHMATQANVPADGSQEAAPSHFTGIILLFSAGTFLYIATVHVLPELIDSKCSSNSSSTREMMTGSRELLLGGHASGLAGPISRLSLSEICLFCVSALLPAFISLATHGEHGH